MHLLCHFTLYGDFDIQTVKAVLSLEPSATLEKGELIDIEGKTVPSRIASWELYGPVNLRVMEQAEFLITSLSKHKEAVRKLAEQFQAHLCVALRDDPLDTLTLRPEFLGKLAEMNISLTCDSVNAEAEDAN